MDIENEIQSLSAETLAIQLILTAVLRRLPQADIEAALEEALEHSTIVAMRYGSAHSAPHTGKVMQIVEQLREAVTVPK